MPVWSKKPEDVLQDSLMDVMKDLEAEVADNPTFHEVSGLPLGALVAHASEALGPLFAERFAKEGPEALNGHVQSYCLGFVVGKKFGERNHINQKEEHDD